MIYVRIASLTVCIQLVGRKFHRHSSFLVISMGKALALVLALIELHHFYNMKLIPSHLFSIRAMEVLDLLFNFRFNTRLEQFVHIFKRTHQQSTNANSDMPEIGHLLYETFDIEDKPGVCKAALRRLEEMFYKTDYLRGNFDLIAILLVCVFHTTF